MHGDITSCFTYLLIHLLTYLLTYLAAHTGILGSEISEVERLLSGIFSEWYQKFPLWGHYISILQIDICAFY